MSHIVRYRKYRNDPFTSDVCHNGYIAALNHAAQIEHILYHRPEFELSIIEFKDNQATLRYQYKSRKVPCMRS